MTVGPGWDPTLALDDNGVPALTVTQGVDNPLLNRGDTTLVTHWNDGRWQRGAGWFSEHVGIVPDHIIGSASSLAFAGSTAQIAFNTRYRFGRTDPMTLKMATKAGWQWNVQTLDDTGWIWQAAQQVSGKSTWVVYTDPTSPDRLRVGEMANGKWAVTSFPIPHALINSLDLAVTDPDGGKPILGVATTALTSGIEGLHFTTSSDGGVTWSASVHIDDTWGMIGPQIAYSGHNPIITYTELDARKAKIAHSLDGGATWQYETIATFDSNPATAVAVSPVTGEPVVAITARDMSANESRLYLARRGLLGNWVLEVVDSVDLATGQRFAVDPRIVIDENDTAMIAYEVYNLYEESVVRFAWSDPQSSVITPPGPGTNP